ncbi:MAG: glycoside hydrolase family 10 protein [Agathobacter sp.]
MKRIAFILMLDIVILIFTVCILTHFILSFPVLYQEKAEEAAQISETETVEEPFRGVWISYLELKKFHENGYRTEEEFIHFIGEIYKNCSSYGINQVIVHVRPFSDALYPSDIYPASSILSGQQGQALDFDPLEIMVSMAHKYHLKFHAWINPYRVLNDNDITKLDKDSTIYRWIQEKNRNVLCFENKYYLNPSKEETKQMILDGIEEIITNYDVDGIHFDDYWYPVFHPTNVSTSFDAKEYEQYQYRCKKKEIAAVSICDWRREQVSTLVKSVQTLIKSHNNNLTFGISPVGNLDVVLSDLQYYMDIDLWMKEQNDYIDYLCPQIYWGFQNPDAPFEKMVKEWTKRYQHSDVKLYIGLPAYKINSDEEPEFKNKNIINDMMNVCYENYGIQDFVYYRYEHIQRYHNKIFSLIV